VSVRRWNQAQIPDGRPGLYYVTARSENGRVAFLVGPFRQPIRPGDTAAHERALAAVLPARREVDRRNYRDTTWGVSFGTSWLPLTTPNPPRGVLGTSVVLTSP
jgi:hypothetical protein